MTQNTNPRCARCGGVTYGASQTCFSCGDQRDSGPVYVSERRDIERAEGRYPNGHPGVVQNLHPRWAEEVPLPGFEGLV